MTRPRRCQDFAGDPPGTSAAAAGLGSDGIRPAAVAAAAQRTRKRQAKPRRFTSKRDAVSALRRYVDAHGELPTAKRPVEGLPSPWIARQLFGSWNGYIRAAGLTPRPYRRWNQQQAITALKRWAAEHSGQPPSRAQWPEDAPTHPSYWRVSRLFGSWTDALHQAELVPRKSKPCRWTDEAILDALRQWADAYGAPHASDWSTPAPDHPTRALVTRRFGSWTAALIAAGLKPPRSARWTPEGIVTAMQAWALANHRPPSPTDWKRAGPEHPNRVHVWKRFGSWADALCAAGLATADNNAMPEPSSSPSPR